MKIVISYIYKVEIVVVDITGNLTSRGAIELQEHLYKFLNEGKCNLLFNFKYVQKVDGLGINILLDVIRKGMRIRLYNVGSEIRRLIRMSKKEHIIKVYNELDPIKVVSLFEREILDERDKVCARIKEEIFLNSYLLSKNV